MQWGLNPKTEKLELKFDFNEGELNSFFDFNTIAFQLFIRFYLTRISIRRKLPAAN